MGELQAGFMRRLELKLGGRYLKYVIVNSGLLRGMLLGAETRSEHVTGLPLNDECRSSVEHARAWY